MNRIEALNVLGLDSDATEKDIKVAYRECAQILHPDRFASNAKLQDRATEQFKRLQDAYEYLTDDKARRTSASGLRSSAPSGAKASYRAVEARLAGLAAAKAQLTAQRDALSDERRISFDVLHLCQTWTRAHLGGRSKALDFVFSCGLF